MENVILYARKSTDVEDKQVLSIDAQLIELRKFAAQNNLRIIDELIEKRTAKMPGRPVFDSLLTRIKNGEVTGILAWHPDRLARNSVDGGQIVYLVDQGLIRSLHFPTFWFEPTPQGKFMLNMAFGQSKYYVDSLSENTKRGLREKIRRGEYPGFAPLGYLNDKRTRTIVVDPQFSSVIRQIYETYSSGRYTLREISLLLKEKGAISRTAKPFCLDKVRRILTNPFYTGLFYYGGELYEGSHEPIISKTLFDKVQQVLKTRSRNQPNYKNPLVYCGLLRCPCGMMITAEKHIKHYKNGNSQRFIYYRCTRKSRTKRCIEPAIRFEKLDQELCAFLLDFAPDKAVLEWLYNKVEQDSIDNVSAQTTASEKLQDRLRALEAKQNMLVDSYLEQDIDRQTFLNKKEQILNEKKQIKEHINDSETNQNRWVEPMLNWLDSLGSICKIVENGSFSAKKELAQKLFGLNLFLHNKTLHLRAPEGAEGAGENGLATPAPQAHFRLYSELRSVIKKSYHKHENYDLDSSLVGIC